MKVIQEIKMQTINRGVKRFIISETPKGYFAHEVGCKTQFAVVFNRDDLKAHRLNPTKRYGNQYGRYYRPKPFASLQEAMNQVIKTAFQTKYYF